MQNVIEAKNLSATYRDNSQGLHVLDKIDLSVSQQEFICILGPSGSGKSTLLHILAGLLPLEEGQLRVNNENVSGAVTGVGFIFQNANLMPWRTVLENVLLPIEVQPIENISQVDALELLNLVGLDGFENSYPQQLSGGMAQRVAIARALIHNPSILLLDEPFGALDAITRTRMGFELLRIWRQQMKTVIMVTHDISEAIFLADRVIVLSNRPAHITLELPIDLPRPRVEEMRYTQKFAKLARILHNTID
jgi:NitT/TauT family transport system ATP-binding protein